MVDRLTPMEAEVLEMAAPEKACEPQNSYGTAPLPKQKKSHVGLWVGIGLIVIGLCTFGVIAAMFEVRFERDAQGNLRLTMRTSEQTTVQNPVRDLSILPEPEGSVSQSEPYANGVEGLFDFSSDPAAALTASELYAKVSPAVVCVEMNTYYGTQYSTGVVISSDGYLLSCISGSADAASMKACFSDGTETDASVIGEDPVTGICLLKTHSQRLPTVVFEADPALTVGEQVYCVGNPYGTAFSNVFYAGMLAGTTTADLNGSDYTLLQTSADIQNAGYGCPIFNSAGRVIGLSSAVGSQFLSFGTDPCFGVCAADLQRIVSGFSGRSECGRLWLGFEVDQIPIEYQYLFNYPDGIWITEVSRGTRVYDVLMPYDIILSVNGSEVRTTDDFYSALNGESDGIAKLIIFRSGKKYYAEVPVLSR